MDIVDDPSQFDGGNRKYRNAFYYKLFTFLRNGKMKLGDNPWVSWTKGFVIHSKLRVRNSYEIKKVGDYKYMFLEWNSGDTVYRNEKPYYYVLKHDE